MNIVTEASNHVERATRESLATIRQRAIAECRQQMKEIRTLQLQGIRRKLEDIVPYGQSINLDEIDDGMNQVEDMTLRFTASWHQDQEVIRRSCRKNKAR